MSEKIYCGSARVIPTQYGDLTKVSFHKDDVQKLMDNLENGWVNLVIKEKKEKVDGKPTHYLEVDTWKPEPNSSQQSAQVDNGNDLPF